MWNWFKINVCVHWTEETCYSVQRCGSFMCFQQLVFCFLNNNGSLCDREAASGFDLLVNKFIVHFNFFNTDYSRTHPLNLWTVNNMFSLLTRTTELFLNESLMTSDILAMGKEGLIKPLLLPLLAQSHRVELWPHPLLPHRKGGSHSWDRHLHGRGGRLYGRGGKTES